MINQKLLLLLQWMNRIFFYFFLFLKSIRITTLIKTSSAQTSHFPPEKTKWKLLKTEVIELLFTDVLRTQTLLSMKRFFSSRKNYQKFWRFLFSIFEKKTNMPTLPAGRLGFLENLITTLKQLSDKKTVIHSVVETYHPDLTDPLNVNYQDMIQKKSIPLNWLELIFKKIK